MTKIKLCGLTRPCDIEAANKLMPEYIGFVFAPGSRRYVTKHQAAALKELLLPKITAVGVFVDEKPEIIAGLLREGIIDMAQLHGSEDAAYIRMLRTLTDRPLIQAFRMGGEAGAAEKCVTAAEESMTAVGKRAVTSEERAAAAKKRAAAAEKCVTAAESSTADAILLDSGAGCGTAFCWELARKVRRAYFLAGGLTAENVGEAVRLLAPAAVDVSSGIETDGHKDAEKMASFVAAVREEDRSCSRPKNEP